MLQTNPMHYIQNNWFSDNWLLIILIFLGALTLIAYINNKKQMLKKAFITLSVYTGFIITLTCLAPSYGPLRLEKQLLPEFSSSENSIENATVFSQIVKFVLNTIKDKLSS